jgi:hypothetical protein
MKTLKTIIWDMLDKGETPTDQKILNAYGKEFSFLTSSEYIRQWHKKEQIKIPIIGEIKDGKIRLFDKVK